MVKKKKIFPKLKKKLKWFLTDESGKISKKDALWLAVGAVLLSWIDVASAGHTSWPSWHVSGTKIGWHVSAGKIAWHVNNAKIGWHVSAIKTATGHGSSIANWHVSKNVTPNWWHSSWYAAWWHSSWYGYWWHSSWYAAWWHCNWTGHASHASHASHGSHGQW